jgi:hypothetical protein
VGADGVFEVLIRWGFSGSGITEREGRYVLVSSDPYLLVSPGVLYLGGLEEAGDLPGKDANRIELPRGRYSAVVHLVDWKADPESVGRMSVLSKESCQISSSRFGARKGWVTFIGLTPLLSADPE